MPCGGERMTELGLKCQDQQRLYSSHKKGIHSRKVVEDEA